MTTKGNVVLYLDKDLVEKSKELGFNLSKTFENHLKQLITGNSPLTLQNNANLQGNNGKWCGRRDLNPGSLAWKAQKALIA
ncbi:MAG: type II toxin-antitoxin system CcdA family antitoxin [Candidatus Bathyarchaeia archaeon]